MANADKHSGISSNRLEKQDCADNFADLHPPLSHHEAIVAAERCYFCYDAPCVTACPTQIDIPLFIRQISTGNAIGSAHTIFSQNIMGGMCARVCPTETLCEQVCVREEAEGKPVKIGELQRFATDTAMAQEKQFFQRAPSSGKKIAIVGAGPAGLACAHRLAVYGHDITIYDAKEKPGGLNEYGIAAYKTVDNFAQDEVAYITAIGGISVENGKSLGKDISLENLAQEFDAVFLGIGLGATGDLGIEGEQAEGVEDAIDFIANLRQAKEFSSVPIGNNVIVIGGGMTAIDAAIQAKHLGAREVTICYRRGKEQMAASGFEQDLATAAGVTIRHWMQPDKIIEQNGSVNSLQLQYTATQNGKLAPTGEQVTLAADQIFKAIGQKLDGQKLQSAGLEMAGNRIKINAQGKTTMANIWAGGDCAEGGDDLTVSAVAMGRDAAEDINSTLKQGDK